MALDGILKQSTAVTVLIGPFVDDNDGNTVEDSLTLSQADIRLSKNGGNMAQKNESTSCTHDELGYYSCPLDTTDTNTPGILKLMVHESGALPVTHSYIVVTANVYDSLVAGTDLMDVSLVQWLGTAPLALTSQRVQSDPGSVTVGTNNDKAGYGLADDAITSAKFDESTAFPLKSDDSGATQVARVGADGDTLETISDQMDGIGSQGNAIKAVTDKLDDTMEDDGGIYRFTENALEEAPSGTGGDATAANQSTIMNHLTDLKGTGFVKDTDSMVDLAHTGAEGDTLETLSVQMDGIGNQAGAGGITWTYTLTDAESGNPIGDADVWLTTDEAGSNVVASGVTDASGSIKFYLDAGTYYLWRKKSGWNFTNPDMEEVSE